MSLVSAPYGLRPVNLLGGRVFAGSTRMIKIPSGYATSIFNGDPVLLTAAGASRGTLARFSGTVAQGTVTAAATLVGVLLGVEYTVPDIGPIQKHFWTGGTVAADAIAYVCDDPDVLFMVQANAALTQVALGTNASIIQTVVGNVATGNSGVGLNAASVADTATLPLRIVDFVNAPGSTIGDAFTDVIVRINTHFNRTALGVAAA